MSENNHSQHYTTVPSPLTLIQMDGLACLQIDHPQATALVALQGAQVLRYIPTGAQPVIWLSESAAFTPGKSVRGGIPVCWPWFGDAARNPSAVRQSLGSSSGTDSLPAHGWARDQLWLLDNVHSDDEGVTLTLRLPRSVQIASAWPMEVDLELVLFFGKELRLQLTTHNRSAAAVTLSQALHSYFSVSHINQVNIQHLQGCNYLDTLDDWQTKSDADKLTIAQETDRIYLDVPSEVCIEDRAWQRRIVLRSSGSHSAVVWNPWIDKAKRLSQFDDSAYQRMLCIETANVMADCIKLEPGDSHTLGVAICSETLAANGTAN